MKSITCTAAREKLAATMDQVCEDRAPLAGIGRPEPSQHGFQGYWARRIHGEHRMVYRIVGDRRWIAQLRYHFSD